MGYRNSESDGRFDIRMMLPGVYRASEDEVVEFVVESNMTSDNHFINFFNLLKAVWYPIIILLSSIRRVFLPVLSGDNEFEAAHSRSKFGCRDPL